MAWQSAARTAVRKAPCPHLERHVRAKFIRGDGAMAAEAIGGKVEEGGGATGECCVPPVSCPELASYACHGGNVVRPLVDGFVAFNRIYEAIASAKHSVWVVIGFLEVGTTWPVAGSPTTFDVFDAAAARGVDVRVLFWGASDVFGGVFFRSAEHFELCVA